MRHTAIQTDRREQAGTLSISPKACPHPPLLPNKGEKSLPVPWTARRVCLQMRTLRAPICIWATVVVTTPPTSLPMLVQSWTRPKENPKLRRRDVSARMLWDTGPTLPRKTPFSARSSATYNNRSNNSNKSSNKNTTPVSHTHEPQSIPSTPTCTACLGEHISRSMV